MLEAIGIYNNFSPELRKKLEDEKEAVGKFVKYRFLIAHRNPDPDKTAGEYIYPSLYTLFPVTFKIVDPGDKKQKTVGMVNLTNEKGEATGFKRIEVNEGNVGYAMLDMSKNEDVTDFEYLELHPRNENGWFRDKNVPAMFTRVDEIKDAKNRLHKRNLRAEAMSVANKMSEQEVRDFAAAMNWDEHTELELLRDKLMEIADKDPEFYEKFMNDVTVEYKASLRRAMDRNIIAWVAVENKFVWVSNGQTIAKLERMEGEKYMQSMAEWFYTHKNGPETYKRMKTLLSSK